MTESNKKLVSVLVIFGIAFFAVLWLIAFNISVKVTDNKNNLLDNMTYFKEYTMSSFPSGTFTKADTEGYGIVVYNGWAPWCPSCVSEMPTLNKLSQEYSDKGILVVGIVADYSDQIGTNSNYTDDIANVVEQYDIKYPIALSDEKFAAEVEPTMEMSFPTTWVVDKDGNLIDYFIGAKSDSDWNALFSKWSTMAVEE